MMSENNSIMPEKNPEDTSSYISVDEMAKMLSIARATAYQLTKIDNFPCFYVGKRIIIPLTAFNEWAKKQAGNKSVFFEK